ncbi:glutaminase [Moniliophthora roreri MCA 2997]|uniref:Glutaminase n=1 Tax=Moniliophthora roreri (strain MCA 2997) TaxID=1381753 RepID=V2XSQ9_MONRO|nr:glutaminase [Moniliophthora roreri MCA 2997]
MHNSIIYFVFHLAFALNTLLVNSQFTSTRNFYPAAYPLAVRSPYLNAWALTQNGTTSLNIWPMHWDDDSILGMTGYVRIDGVAWQWLGDSPIGNRTTLENTEITPTRSIFTILAGPCRLNVTFFSPIQPSNWVVQSFPFVYISVDVESLDGDPHDIQLYSDISAEWASGDPEQVVTWNTTTAGLSVYHQVSRQIPQPMTETKNIADDSNVYFAMSQNPGLTWQTAADNVARTQFMAKGRLLNTQDTNFRRINDRFIVFALSVDLGGIESSTSSTVWSLGVVRDPVVMYSSSNGPQSRSPFFRTQYNHIGDAIDAFGKNYSSAVGTANQLDRDIMRDGDAISTKYGNLLALSTRQAMAAVDITVSLLADGKGNLSDVKAFMKDTGTSQRINPVDTIFAAFPIYLYMDPSLGGLLLDPLFEYQASIVTNDFDVRFAGPDLGMYPKAFGSSGNNENTALENTGNMLVMALAHAQFSGDGTLIYRYYDLLKTWTDYLINDSLHPTNQLSSDRIAKDNMSNLAIKGIIGIAAMSGISKALNRANDTEFYSTKASELLTQWAQLATLGGHVVSIYNEPSSEGLIYNLYADTLLQTKLVPKDVYDGLTSFYDNRASQAPRFGLPYDSNAAGEAKAPWTIFAAATTTNSSTRDKLIDMAHSRAAFNETAGDFPTTYKTDTGQSFLNYGQASPAQGAMFALLTTRLEIKSINVPASSSQPPDNSDSESTDSAVNAGVIAGAVIGSFVGVVLIAMCLFLLWRKRRQRRDQERLKPIPFNPNLLYRQRGSSGFRLSAERSRPTPAQPSSLVDASPRNHPSRSETYARDSHAPTSPTNTSQSQAYSTYSGSQFTTDTSHLRHEIANLRQQMVEMQAQQTAWAPTPPPRYDNSGTT